VAIDEAVMSDLERIALAHCGPGEEGLRQTALSIVSSDRGGLAAPGPGALAFAQRVAGEPHPWARAWRASAGTLSSAAAVAKLDAWLGSEPLGLRRCGVAAGVRAEGQHALAVVTVEALADLAPLPIHARVGQFLTVDARLHVHASAASVMVLGPDGWPRSLLTAFDGTHVRARFAPDSPGEFAVQVVADTSDGPRPVIEASVFADVPPPARLADQTAPGEEEADDGVSGDAERLARMVNAARASAGLSRLARDRAIDGVALEHARRMAQAGRLAHDAGDGSPADRIAQAGMRLREAGENVAHAVDVALAHRLIWSSPAHRANLLRRDFDKVGVAVVRDAQGEAWVVEMFAR
jgi:uncharacterized protein YkwD